MHWRTFQISFKQNIRPSLVDPTDQHKWHHQQIRTSKHTHTHTQIRTVHPEQRIFAHVQYNEYSKNVHLVIWNKHARSPSPPLPKKRKKRGQKTTTDDCNMSRCCLPLLLFLDALQQKNAAKAPLITSHHSKTIHS